jgi:hypothetical protein
MVARHRGNRQDSRPEATNRNGSFAVKPELFGALASAGRRNTAHREAGRIGDQKLSATTATRTMTYN